VAEQKKFYEMGEWPRPPIPNAVKPGRAVIVNKVGKDPQMIECWMIVRPVEGTEIRPLEGKRNRTMTPGALLDAMASGEVNVAQWAPYDPKDGAVVGGAGIQYPPKTMFTEFNGVYYHVNWGSQYLQAAMREAEQAAGKSQGELLKASK